MYAKYSSGRFTMGITLKHYAVYGNIYVTLYFMESYHGDNRWAARVTPYSDGLVRLVAVLQHTGYVIARMLPNRE